MYNENQNILKALDHIEKTIPELGFTNYEILVIDDGSRDGCVQLVEEAARRNEHIRIVRHPHNMGYGAALRTGFTQATRDLVFYTDCDLPADLKEIRRALPDLEHADLVIGYRKKRYETLRRAIYSRIYNRLMGLMFGVHVKDVNFSFKLVRRPVLQKVALTASTVFIDGQLLAEAIRYGFNITEIPIDYTPRRLGRSNFDSLGTACNTLEEMVAYAAVRSGEALAVAIHRA
jgi:glycosyltransferase involved in cell wall biosynthesis